MSAFTFRLLPELLVSSLLFFEKLKGNKKKFTSRKKCGRKEELEQKKRRKTEKNKRGRKQPEALFNAAAYPLSLPILLMCSILLCYYNYIPHKSQCVTEKEEEEEHEQEQKKRN